MEIESTHCLGMKLLVQSSRDDQLPTHENVNGAEDVAVNVKGADLCCLKDYLVRIIRCHRDSRIQIVSNGKPVGLCLVKVAHHEVHHFSLVSVNYGPWVERRPMADAVIEA